MKKLFAIFLALVLVASALPTLGATSLTAPATGQSSGDYTIGVNGIAIPAANAKEVISVDLAWEAMSFTYSGGSSSYNSASHTTTTTPGAWSDNKPAITVINHSNAELTASFAFAAADGVTTTGSFYASASATDPVTDAKLTLASAEGAAADAAPEASICFGVSGDAISENKSLGTITVTLAGPAWKTVDSEESLKNALEAGGYIKLGADIDLTDYINCSSGATATLDLNGHTISQSANEDGVLFT